MFHSEILASLNFNKDKNFVPWIREQQYNKMLFWQFSNIIIFVKIVGKLPEQHLIVLLFSNPGEQVQKRWGTTGQICPVLSTRIWTLSPGLIWYFSNNLDIYDYVGKLPEQNFSVWLFSNPGDNILFLLKFYTARISEWNLLFEDFHLLGFSIVQSTVDNCSVSYTSYNTTISEAAGNCN